MISFGFGKKDAAETMVGYTNFLFGVFAWGSLLVFLSYPSLSFSISDEPMRTPQPYGCIKCSRESLRKAVHSKVGGTKNFKPHKRILRVRKET